MGPASTDGWPPGPAPGNARDNAPPGYMGGMGPPPGMPPQPHGYGPPGGMRAGMSLGMPLPPGMLVRCAFIYEHALWVHVGGRLHAGWLTAGRPEVLPAPHAPARTWACVRL